MALTFVGRELAYEPQHSFLARGWRQGLVGKMCWLKVKQKESVQEELEKLVFRSQFAGENVEF